VTPVKVKDSYTFLEKKDLIALFIFTNSVLTFSYITKRYCWMKFAVKTLWNKVVFKKEKENGKQWPTKQEKCLS
jgi:hypothetical protein